MPSKDTAKLIWANKPKKELNPKDLEFQTVEVVFPRKATHEQQLFPKTNNGNADVKNMNRLIWGDNLLIMQALLNDYEGKINLIYIDPPFWTGDNFYHKIKLGNNELTKTPSNIERLAYRDRWEDGIDSYLDTIYPALQLMRRLLAENGSIYVHLVEKHLYTKTDFKGNQYNKDNIINIHTKRKGEISEEEWDKIKYDVFNIDNNKIKVVISVLMLREGFDVKNICVDVVLRSSETGWIAEQIVGRGLRLMFTEPEFAEVKKQAFKEITEKNEEPTNSLDFLFIVEHPRFIRFYDELREEGLTIVEGDSRKISPAGDIITVDALTERIEEYDIAFPIQFWTEGKYPNIMEIDINSLSSYPTKFEDLQKYLKSIYITDIHVPTEKKTRTWKMENTYFDYNQFLRAMANAIAISGKMPSLSGSKAEIMELVDNYVMNKLFGKSIDFYKQENYAVLNYTEVFDFVVEQIRKKIIELFGKEEFETEEKANWQKLSDIPMITLRLTKSVETKKSIYPRLPFASFGGGFEKIFMEKVLENSSEVIAYAKLDRKHSLKIPYRTESGVPSKYEPDFIVKTIDKMYLVETKAEKDLEFSDVILKAKSAISWCLSASKIELPEDIKQPKEWDYILISENTFYNNPEISFNALIPLCKPKLELLISKYENKWF